MAEQYNGQFTGSEIDGAIQVVRQKEASWDDKQDQITGKKGQIVGFDDAGKPVAQDAPSGGGGETSNGLPAGGAAGQVLAKKTAEDYDAQWVDPPEGGGETDGVSSFNGRSGAVMPQSGDYTAENISFTPGTGMTAENVQSAITELFMSVSEGKAQIASAITDKGVQTSADASFDTMQANILAIPAGGLPEDVCTIDVQASDPAGGTVSGGGVASAGMTVTVSADANSTHFFDGWKENGTTVSGEKVYTFPVSVNRALVADFAVPTYISGIDWFGTTLPSSGRWYDVAYGNGKFVTIMYDSNKAAYSSDGINWVETTLPFSESWSTISYGNGKFVVLGSGSTKAAYSSDGINWIASTLPISDIWKDVIYGNDKFVAVAYSSKNAIYSTDGINWVATTMPSNLSWSNIAYGDGKFVTTSGSFGRGAYSTDGITWKTFDFPSTSKWGGVCYGNGRFVAAVYNSDKLAISSNGTYCVAKTLPLSANWTEIAYGDGKFVMTVRNSDKVAYSQDGIDWTMATLPISSYWDGIAYGNNKFVMTADYSSDKVAYSYTGV